MPQLALKEITAGAGLAETPVEIAGDDPVLPVRYRIAAAASGALGALGVAVANLSAPQRVSVNARAAAVSLRSARYLRINGKPLPSPWDPFSGFYPLRDGWISIHCNFPNHREAAMKVLGVGEDRARAESASRSWEGEDLEEAIHAAGGCAGYVRSQDEWLAHPQARAIAEQPLVHIERVGDSAAEPAGSRSRPLEGIRVLDLTRVLAGPTCGKSLAEHGADVLKISAAHLPDSGLVELDTGIGKRSARIDLRIESETLRSLAKRADVFLQSYRPGTLAARGFAPQALAELRPGIVCASLDAWGPTGPWRDRRGFDSIVQAVSGIAHAHGDAARPRLLPVSAIDYVSGYLLAFGVSVPGSELAERLAEMDAPDGRIRYLKPVLELSRTPAYFARPPVPLGYHPASWISR